MWKLSPHFFPVPGLPDPPDEAVHVVLHLQYPALSVPFLQGFAAHLGNYADAAADHRCLQMESV